MLSVPTNRLDGLSVPTNRLVGLSVLFSLNSNPTGDSALTHQCGYLGYREFADSATNSSDCSHDHTSNQPSGGSESLSRVPEVLPRVLKKLTSPVSIDNGCSKRSVS